MPDDAIGRGAQGHHVAFDVETAHLDPIAAKYPDPIRLNASIAMAERNGCRDWCRRHRLDMELLPDVGPHECRESTTCRCRADADEPDDRCPVHGSGPYPPKCAECGRYMRRRREVERDGDS